MNLDLIIATHNRANLLKACLDSIFLATHPAGLRIHVVVVDNNSTDETRSMVQRYAEHPDVSLQYIFAGRPGKSAALNDALAQTSGELVGLIDDDEQLESSWFEVVHREFSADPELDFIGGQYHPNWETLAPDWVSKSFRGAIGIVLNPVRVNFTPAFPGILMGGNAVIRRAVLNKVLPYPEHLGKIGKKIRSGEDEVIYHRLLAMGARGVNVPELIIYHWIPTSRLTKRYFRRWVIGRGISGGSQIRERGFKETGLLGIPRYQFGLAAKACGILLSSRLPAERFAAQLTVLDCMATLYGRHFG
jgi:glycosyltransferase involved in cell wall biosynthesis